MDFCRTSFNSIRLLLLLLILFFIIPVLCTNSIDESFKWIEVLLRYTRFFLLLFFYFVFVLCVIISLFAINGFHFTR